MNLTREQAIENHRKLWNWIADETMKKKKVVKKEEYFRMNSIDEIDIPINGCYCCEYTKPIWYYDCLDSCPIAWLGHGSNNLCSGSDQSPYSKWCEAVLEENWEESYLNALAIANLPESEGSK